MDIMIGRILRHPDAFIVSQQRGEADPTEEQKRKILTDLFNDKKDIFLQRYHSLLLLEDCTLFRAAAVAGPGCSRQDSDVAAMVAYYLSAIEHRKIPSAAVVRNRRYLTLQKLKAAGNYFSDVCTRQREPRLFDMMIGRFMTEQQQQELRPTVDRTGSWAGLLQQFEESGEIAQRRHASNEEWDSKDRDDPRNRLMAHVNLRIEDEDMDEEEDVDEVVVEEKPAAAGVEEMEALRKEVERIEEILEDEDADPAELRLDFQNLMEQRFLAGLDKAFFDYSQVDNDESLDELDRIHEQDIEEKYFDSD